MFEYLFLSCKKGIFSHLFQPYFADSCLDALRLAGEKKHTGIIMLKLFQKSRKTQEFLEYFFLNSGYAGIICYYSEVC